MTTKHAAEKYQLYTSRLRAIVTKVVGAAGIVQVVPEDATQWQTPHGARLGAFELQLFYREEVTAVAAVTAVTALPTGGVGVASTVRARVSRARVMGVPVHVWPVLFFSCVLARICRLAPPYPAHVLLHASVLRANSSPNCCTPSSPRASGPPLRSWRPLCCDTSTRSASTPSSCAPTAPRAPSFPCPVSVRRIQREFQF